MGRLKGDRKEHPAPVSKMLLPRSHLFLKCFSNREKGEEGPYRIAPEEIEEVFSSLSQKTSPLTRQQ